MPVQLVEQIDDTDLAGNLHQFMQATFTVGDQSGPLIARVPLTPDWVSVLEAEIANRAAGVRQILGLNP